MNVLEELVGPSVELELNFGSPLSLTHPPPHTHTSHLCAIPVGAIAPWWRRRRLHPGSSQRRADLRESGAGLHTTGQDPQRAVRGETRKRSYLFFIYLCLMFRMISHFITWYKSYLASLWVKSSSVHCSEDTSLSSCLTFLLLISEMHDSL